MAIERDRSDTSSREASSERGKEIDFLYIFLFSSFIFSFSRIRVVDLRCNIELRSLYIELPFFLNLS